MRACRRCSGPARGALHAFGPADLTIEQGEFVSLLGPSGCGKSTLMLMIAGLLDADRGARSRIDGRTVAGPQTDIGIMFQDNTLVPWRTVRGNIELQLELRGLDPAAHRDRVDELLASVHLDDFADGATRTSSPAACSSAPPSARRWCTSPRRCCSTSRSASSTP